MKMKKLKSLFLTALLATMLSGCTIGFNTGANTGASGAIDGGVYKSSDKGTNWDQKVLIQSVSSKRSFATVDIISLAMDPQDNKAIYAGSLENGLFYSYDGGESWQISTTLGKVSVTNVAVDPVNKCIIYATVANKVYKSVDCSRTWAVVYFDNNLKTAITSLVIDFSSNNIFIGTSRGEIIESSDQGGAWRTLNRFNIQVDKIVFNPVNAKTMFVGTSAGIFRSVDAGLSWTNLKNELKAYDGNRPFRDLIMIRADKPTIFLATSYGLLKSTDGGNSWSPIELITPVSGAKINAIIANPFSADEIYYATDTTFYRSLDGGKNWSSKQLPTSRVGAKLLIDPKNPSIIYLAVRLIKK